MTTSTHGAMAIWAPILALLALTATSGAAQELPVVKGKKVVAIVQGDPITLDEFTRQVAATRAQQALATPVDRAAELALLDRLILGALIAQEARRMGLDAVPEIRKMIDSFARQTLREELVEHVTRDTRADPKEVEAVYQAAVREWKISAALFARPEHAASLAADLGAGKDFHATARSYLADGRATGVEDGVVLKRDAMDPAIAAVVAGMAVGATSPVVTARSGLVVVRLEEVRYPDNPVERARAEQSVLAARRREVVAALDQSLRKKWVKVRPDVLAGLDYEADSPGIEALLKDTRALAEIRGEKPVTVAELTEEMRYQFFHGMGMAAERKRLNARKQQVLDGIVHRRLFRKEALRLKLDRTESYRGKVKDYEHSALFGAFVRKVILPGLTLKESEIRAYYDEHRAEYMQPELMRIRSLAFSEPRNAQRALEALQKGADLQWVASNAEGQVDRQARGVLAFDGKPIVSTELPDGVRRALAGAVTGDFRLYASPEGHVYVLAVQDVVAAAPQPYEQLREEIGQKVLDVKARTEIEAYADKLRALSDVKVYLKAS